MNEAPVAPNVPAEKPVKQPPVRRVGSITMGLTLIAAGVLLCVWLIHPGNYIFTALKLSPLILVLLGVEIIVSFTVFRDKRLKYDFLSIILCFVLLIAAGTGTAVALVGQYWNASLALPKQLDTLRIDCAEFLQDLPVEKLKVYTTGNWPNEWMVSYTEQELQTSSALNIEVVLSGSYASEKSFAQDVLKTAQVLNHAGICPGGLLIIASGPEDTTFTSTLDGLFTDGLTVQSIADAVQTSHDSE